MIGLLLPTLFLCVFGFFNLLGINNNLVWNYIEYMVVGLFLYFVGRRVGIRFFKINSLNFYILFVIILLITYIVGLEARGSKRWIDLYVFNFQPSEFFKIFFILYFAQALSAVRRKEPTLSTFFKFCLLFAIPTLIIFKQPDLGSAMVYTVVFMTMILFSSIPKRYLLFLTIITIVSLPIGIYTLKDYQKARILSFISPHVDRQGSSYNMTQAIITVGSGKLIGRGLGLGTQSQLHFLPENHTDFAYSSLVEQFGFVGGFVVILLYAMIFVYLVQRLLRYHHRKSEEEAFNFYMILGFLSMILFQVFINIGMNLGMVPITGITLPLISYGGSSLVTLLFAMSLLPL